jgi:hypothetical protein
VLKGGGGRQGPLLCDLGKHDWMWHLIFSLHLPLVDAHFTHDIVRWLAGVEFMLACSLDDWPTGKSVQSSGSSRNPQDDGFILLSVWLCYVWIYTASQSTIQEGGGAAKGH